MVIEWLRPRVSWGSLLPLCGELELQLTETWSSVKTFDKQWNIRKLDVVLWTEQDVFEILKEASGFLRPLLIGY